MHYLENPWLEFQHHLSDAWIPYALTHWRTISISVGVGAALTMAFTALYALRRYAWAHRVINMFKNSDLNVLEVSSWLGTVRCLQTDRNLRAVASMPPPSLLGDGMQRLQNLSLDLETITYRFPENPHGAGPVGIAFPTRVTLLYETGTHEHLLLTPVLLEKAGIWKPAKVHLATNMPTNPFHIPKRDALEYRNFFLTEFVEVGDVLGAVVPQHGRPVTVTAPVSGRIVHFGALDGTPLLRHACPFLIAAMPDLGSILAPEIGTFTMHPADGNILGGSVGSVVKANTALGAVRFLGGQSAEVFAPCDLVILRQYVKDKQRVDFSSRLFLYTPLC